jgi:hypothetical protein
MTAVTFDTHKLIKTLEAAGMPAPQAEAVSYAIRESTSFADTELVTRKDMELEFQKLKVNDIAPMKADILLLKWMTGVVVAGVIALVMKAFLHG